MKSRRLIAVGVSATMAFALASLTEVGTSAAPSAAAAASSPDKVVRSSLGNGLGRLVQGDGKGARSLSTPLIDPNATAIRDDQGRVMVDLTPRAGTDRVAFRQQAEANGLDVQAVDSEHGTLEGYASLDAVRALAAMRDTGTLNQAVRPHVNTGSVDDQGVPFQRVDKVHRRGVNGRGVTVGALSDSYDEATTDVFGDPLLIHAADDVASGDLPGPGNPVNSHPVQVLEDSTSGLDEGRGMLQLVHDYAPKADLCFATANGGEVNFANNIRALADPSGPCGADVVVDDVTYFSEPFFSDGVISDAVDDVTAQGVQYFSSAGNGGEHQAWRMPLNLVPASSAATGTNLDFSDVPPELYDGGVQDMDPGPGVDPAMDYAFEADGGIFDLQWDDPVDLDGPTLGAPLFEATGEITDADPAPSFTFTATAADVGQQVLFRTDAIPSGTTDLILTVLDPDGNNLGTIDTGSSPEVLATTLATAGDYTIIIEGFDGDTGDFTVDVSPITESSSVTTDLNALVFFADGTFAAAIADINTLSGRPSELAQLPNIGEDLQIVISRSGTGPTPVTMLGSTMFDGMYVDEYFDPLAPATFGHHMAAGAVGVAAYDAFRPFLPEFFTSPGGKALPVRFDSSGNEYARIQKRTSPLIASVDGANTTFFTSDTARDDDTLPNFFGTSAAAPHAAAIAALVLDKHGGGKSVKPAKMKRILSKSVFKHDLDPSESAGKAGKVTITATGDQGDERSPYVGPNRDPNFFRVSNAGGVPVSSITFFGAGASPTALGNGIVFDPRPNTGVPPFREQGFPFTVGGTSGGLNAGSVSATFAGAGGGQSVAGQFRNMTVHFGQGLRKGQAVSFGVDRDLTVSGVGLAAEGNSADELGGAVSIPDGRVLRDGMRFKAVLANGSVVRGVFRNDLGTGYTPVDGFGLLDAVAAVF